MLWLMGSTWSAGMARCSAQRSDPCAKELHTRVLARGAARVSLRVLAKNTARRCFHCRPCQDGAHCRRVPPHLSHSLPHGCRPPRAPHGTNPRAPFSKAPSSNKPAHSAADARPQRPTPAPHRPPHSDVQHATKPPVAAPLTLYFPSSRVLPINVVKMPPTPPMPTQPAICACWFLRGGRQVGVRTAVRRDARVRGVRASVRRAAGAARRAPASECDTAF